MSFVVSACKLTSQPVCCLSLKSWWQEGLSSEGHLTWTHVYSWSIWYDRAQTLCNLCQPPWWKDNCRKSGFGCCWPIVQNCLKRLPNFGATVQMGICTKKVFSEGTSERTNSLRLLQGHQVMQQKESIQYVHRAYRKLCTGPWYWRFLSDQWPKCMTQIFASFSFWPKLAAPFSKKTFYTIYAGIIT